MFQFATVFFTWLGMTNFAHGQIRYHEPHPDIAFNYSYINVFHMKGFKLVGAGEEPLSSISTPNRTDCHKECVSRIKQCKSINVLETPEGNFECEAMPIDIYGKSFLVADPKASHYVIAVWT